jgi:DNA-nicking Smr family endonuclease
MPSSGSRRLRLLSDDEIELWLTVTRSITPRPGAHLPDPPARETPDEPPKTAAAPAVLPPGPAKPPAAPKVPALAPIEKKLKQKLSRGRITADAVIDLHGMRQHEALPALQRFLAQAQREGAKLALVVTGKGERNSKESDHFDREVGVLRRLVPIWLGAPEFRPFVIGFEEASRPHGGTGALYVRIRRR